jgi:hypothetical protein
LGYKTGPEVSETGKRKEVLDRLNNGEISVDEAISL